MDGQPFNPKSKDTKLLIKKKKALTLANEDDMSLDIFFRNLKLSASRKLKLSKL